MTNTEATDFGFGGIWGIIMLLIVAGLFSNGGFGFGGNSAGVTEEYIANQFTNRDIWSTNTNVLTSASATQNEILNNRANCNNNYSNLRYDMATGISGVDKDVLLGNQVIQSQMAQNALQAQANLDSCCCSLKTAIHDEGEATRALITQNRISDLEKDLVNANTIISNQVQSQNLLSNLGRFVPYSSYYGTYGTYGTGTTIY